MKWMTSGSVKMFGVNYSSGASVDVSSWSPSQLQQQIYLGNIIQDVRIGNTFRITGDGGAWTGTYPDTKYFVFAARGTFVAPPSGRFMIFGENCISGNSASSVITARVTIRKGTNMNSGEYVHTSVRSYFRGNKAMTEVTPNLSIGMTPGATYNVTTGFTATAGGGRLFYSRAYVVPQPN